MTNPARAAASGPPLTGHTDTVHTVVFAAGSFDETVRPWDVANPARPQAIGGPVTGNQNFVNDVVFGPGGHTLMIADGDFTVRIRDLDVAPAIQYICASTGNILTSAQWRIYVPELAYDPPCGTRQ